MMHSRKTAAGARPADSGMGVSPAGVPLLLRSLPQMPRARVLRATTGSSHLVAAKPAAGQGRQGGGGRGEIKQGEFGRS